MLIKRGTLKSFDAATYKATVQLAGSLPAYLSGISVARNIPAAEMVAGRWCAVVFFDDANPADAVLTAVWT